MYHLLRIFMFSAQQMSIIFHKMQKTLFVFQEPYIDFFFSDRFHIAFATERIFILYSDHFMFSAQQMSIPKHNVSQNATKRFLVNYC